jgi:hypothetical protein
MRLAVVLVSCVAGTTLAFGGDGIPLTVEVGKTVERDVGNANGWFCDDPALIAAELVTRGERNVWIVTGVRVGATQCRVGTDVARASYVFDVAVRPARGRR